MGRSGNRFKVGVIWKILFTVSVLAISIILFLAYTKGIPSFISAVPYYDKVGHFVLYGGAAYVFHRASGRKKVYGLPIAICIFTAFTVIEELLQHFSVNRTFSLADLSFSLAGIATAYLLDRLIQWRSS